jgi:hypothetical protein
MEELDGLGGAVRGLLASLPSDTAVLLLSLLALATLLRASRRVPLNSAFTRRTSKSEAQKERREDHVPDPTESEETSRARTLRRV